MFRLWLAAMRVKEPEDVLGIFAVGPTQKALRREFRRRYRLAERRETMAASNDKSVWLGEQFPGVETFPCSFEGSANPDFGVTLFQEFSDFIVGTSKKTQFKAG